MKLHTLNDIGNCKSIEQYIEKKLSVYRNSEKTFETLYKMMFSDRNNTMAEQTMNFKNKKITYGQCADIIDSLSLKITYTLKDFTHDGVVGLYMANSLEALQIFWAVLKSGYSLIFLNTSLPDDETNLHIKQNGVCAVISDSKQFSVPTFTPEELFSTAGEEKTVNSWGNSVIFMSSGTSGAAKYCYYNAENFYHQIESTLSIVKRCPSIAEGYDGNLKILVLLPFSHVFGFTAVYLWFGFFARTFVFLKDTLPQTVQETVRNHKVTHIFAVPLVWEAIHRKALSKITKTGKRRTFDRLLAISLNGGFTGAAVRKHAMRKVREEIFGDSVKFLISEGCNINSETLGFFNGIGYHLANGENINPDTVEAKIPQEDTDGLCLTQYRLAHKDGQTERELRQTVTSCFAKTLGRSESEISYTGNFFRDFSGSSIDYFDLLGRIREKFGIEIAKDDISLFSVRDFCKYLREQVED
ncbi:MAG: non-ribosomal peptide synthetase [Sphaerochaetaceae bacterium]|nr:non-ribosomal peptide synthetase [Sphaerochaetaceae bacterium]